MERCLISFRSTNWTKYNNNLWNNTIFNDCETEWTQKVLLSVFTWIRRYIVILLYCYIVIRYVKQFGATQHKTDIILQPRNVTVSSNHSSRKCATACIRYPLLWIFNGITRCQQILGRGPLRHFCQTAHSMDNGHICLYFENIASLQRGDPTSLANSSFREEVWHNSSPTGPLARQCPRPPAHNRIL